ncbi:MAG: AI-2E family transporter [Wenzhouxiangellaceae bacterium]
MVDVVRNWFRRTFENPEVVILGLVLFSGLMMVLLFGRMLAPVFASLVLAYLLESVVIYLQRYGLPRLASVFIVFSGFVAGLLVLLFVVAPLLSRQVTQLVQQIPTYLGELQEMIQRLPEKYPNLITAEQASALVDTISTDLGAMGQKLLALSLSSVIGLVTLMVFLVLIPLLVFFFLKDKLLIQNWFRSFMPQNRSLVHKVWQEVDLQIGNYVRGKVLEILVIGSVTSLAFAALGLQYAVLLGTLTGLSVLIPYVGATVVTVPVAAVAFFQWGWGADLAWVLVAYGVIQAIDGNVLVPLLFSEVVDLHPVAIIIAILIFGGIWGFWGVFFAIPLATLVNAVIRAWPRANALHTPTTDIETIDPAA